MHVTNDRPPPPVRNMINRAGGRYDVSSDQLCDQARQGIKLSRTTAPASRLPQRLQVNVRLKVRVLAIALLPTRLRLERQSPDPGEIRTAA